MYQSNQAETLNMQDKIDNHPNITLHKEIVSICDPLTKLGINYFSHVTIQNNQLAALTTHADFFRYYLDHNYHNADIHMSNVFEQQKYIIWDEIQLSGQSKQMDEEGMDFGVLHTFSIHQRDSLGDHYFHFATSHPENEFNNVYVSNLDLLNLFANKFKYTAYNSTALSEAYAIKFGLEENQANFNIQCKSIDMPAEQSRHDFLQDLLKDKVYPLENGNTLTTRHLIILYWLYQGKTVHDISRLLNCAEVTVHKHVNTLKSQINCYTQFQLGAFFANLPTELVNVIRAIFNASSS